jgi:hypothetical protein
MKNLGIALAVILALTLTTLATAEAQSKGRRHEAQKQRQTATQHRAAPRKFKHAAGGRQARHHGRWQDPRRLSRSSKRAWRMKGKHYRAKRGYAKHRRFHRGFHRPRRHNAHLHRIYPVYEQYSSHSMGLEIETEDFRFSVNRSE